MWRRGTCIVAQSACRSNNAANNGKAVATSVVRGYASVSSNFDQLKAELHQGDQYDLLSKMIDQNDDAYGSHVKVDEASVDRELKSLTAKFKNQSNPKSQDVLRKIARMKVIELERAKAVASPDLAKQYVAGLQAQEEALFAAAKTKTKPVELSDAQQKKYVQDPLGAMIYKKAKRMYDILDKYESAQKRAFPSSAQVYAQLILDAVVETSEQETGKDGWKQPPISVLGKEYTTTEQMLDALFDTSAPLADFSTQWGTDSKATYTSTEQKVAAASDGLVTPGHAQYETVAKMIETVDNLPETEEMRDFKKAYESITQRKKELKASAAGVFSQGEQLQKELDSLKAKNVGEYGVFNTALRSFLSENQRPTSMQKLQFMKQQRKVLLQRRAQQNLAQEYPGVNTAPKNLNDNELLSQFDLARDRLYGI